jgi:hypothetical protein
MILTFPLFFCQVTWSFLRANREAARAQRNALPMISNHSLDVEMLIIHTLSMSHGIFLDDDHCFSPVLVVPPKLLYLLLVLLF